MEAGKCKLHGTTGTFFCGQFSCMCIFCESCAYKHCEHDFWVIDQTLSSRVDGAVRDILNNLRSDYNASFRLMQRLEELSTDLHRDATSQTQQILSKFDTLIRKLSTRKNELLTIINDRQTTLAEQLNSSIQDCQHAIDAQMEVLEKAQLFQSSLRNLPPETVAERSEGLSKKFLRVDGCKEVPVQSLNLEFVWEGDDFESEYGSLEPPEIVEKERDRIYFFRDYSSVVWKLDQSSMTWTDLNEPQLPMFRSLTVAYNGLKDSYIVFGTSKHGDFTVQLETTNDRFDITPLPFAFPIWSCAAWLGDSVYLLGGQVGENSLSSCRKFTPDNWSEISDLNCARDAASASGYNHYLYVFGGYFNHQLQCSIEKYYPKKDLWLVCRLHMPESVAYLGVVQVEDGLILLGGEGNGEDSKKKDLASRGVYFWSTFGTLRTLPSLQQGFTNHLTASAEMLHGNVYLLEAESQSEPMITVYPIPVEH